MSARAPQPPRRRPWWRSRWWTPVLCLALGGLVLAAMAAGGEPGAGLMSFGVLAAVSAAFYFGSGSEVLRGLGGPDRDERWSLIDLRATAFAGSVLVTVLAGAWLWELSQGRDGGPYGQVMAAGGIAYLLAIAFLRLRS